MYPFSATRLLLAALALVVAVAATLPAAAQTFPQLTGRVVDEAGVIDPPVKAAIESELADLEARTTDQFVVVTVRSLGGLTIEDYGVRLGRAWKIGQKDKNNGVLLIVAPKERKMRFEVGYGLEGVLTDAQTRLIIANTITPRFRANDIGGGIARGVDEIIRLLDHDTATWQGIPDPPRPRLFTRVMHGIGGIVSYMPGDFLILIGLVLIGCLMSLITMVWLYLLAPILLHIGVWLGLVSPDRLRALAQQRAGWHFFGDGTAATSTKSSGSSSSWSWSSGGSSSSWSGSFGGGGGSFGGGGSSGSW
jgi:uncharacterized protein